MMNKAHTQSLIILIILALGLGLFPISFTQSAANLPVFPGCQGFGCETVGGRGGQVIKVTNLNDSGPGSLRAALEASGPRIVVFEVSGTITLSRDIGISNPYITIAGQTAPSPGITLKNFGISPSTHDILIQHIRVRVGDQGGNGDLDAVGDIFNPKRDEVYNIVLDHLSLGWSNDEIIGSYASNLTISDSILSEALHDANHYDGKPHSKAVLVGERSRNVSIIRNLFAHNNDRNPYYKGDTSGAVINNVIYDGGSQTDILNGGQYGETLPQKVYYAVVGNRYIKGLSWNDPNTHSYAVRVLDIPPGSKLYHTDNLADSPLRGFRVMIASNAAGGSNFDPTVTTWPAELPAIANLVPMPAKDVEAYVTTNAGARPVDRDAVDIRVLNQLKNRTGKWINSQSDVGGWPMLAVNQRTFNIPSNPNGDSDNDGYTNIEEILHQMAAEVEGKATSKPSSPPVFPNCQGFGCETVGGRGGQIIKVTNLNANGPGSFKAAVESSGPRIVVFETSGTIEINDDVVIRNPYLTIAGQTAPSPGITIRGATITVVTHDVLIQHIRMRVGDNPTGPNPGNRDALQIVGDSKGIMPDVSYNVVIDHVSASWAIDETISTWYRGVHDVTISNSIVAESLYNSLHPEGPHSKGMLIGFAKKVSVVNNLIAKHANRNPWFSYGATGVIANNIIYYGGDAGPFIFGVFEEGLSPSLVSIVGNRFQKSSNQQNTPYSIRVHSSAPPGTQVYMSDNTMEGYGPFREDVDFDPVVSNPPIWPFSGITTRPSTQVENYLASNAGARPADRDSVDARIINEVKTRTGKIINSQSEVGGWPTLAVNQRTFNIPTNPNGDSDNDGYTNIEEVLHQMAADIEKSAATPPPPTATPTPSSDPVISLDSTSFNGINDFVKVNTTNFSPNQGSISTRVKASSFKATPQYIFGHTTKPAYSNRIQLYTDDVGGNLDLGLGNSHVTHLNIQQLQSNTWYHIVLTWKSGTYYVYVNDVQKATGSYSGFTNLNTYVHLGGNGYDPDPQSWAGAINNTKIYNYALSASEVKSIHDGITAVVPPPPTFLPQDLNQDGKVNLEDVLLLISDFGKTSGFKSVHDLNQDGLINILDVLELTRRWNQ